MSLINTLDQCVALSSQLFLNIAKNEFGNDSPEARTVTRRFGISEVAEMVGVSRTAIDKAEESGRLPAPDMKESQGAVRRTIRQGYTLEQIHRIREEFNRFPGHMGNSDAVIVSVGGNKGGCLKTTTSAHYAQWAAMQGYKVLVVDMDPQAHLSMYFGYVPDIHVQESETLLPWMLGQADNLDYAIKRTAWPQCDIIPSCLAMQRLEREMPESETLPFPEHLMLLGGLQDYLSEYDIIIVDGRPDLGLGTINQICAADVLLVATSAEMNDFNSSVQFFSAVRDAIANLNLSKEPVVKMLATKVGGPNSSSEYMCQLMKQVLPGFVLHNVIAQTDEVGKGQVRMRTFYEQDREKRSSTSAWQRANSIFNPVFKEITDDLIRIHWQPALGESA